MTNPITPGQIKKSNRQLIYDFIYKKEKVSQQDICYSLHLSRPTVTTNLAELEEAGAIYKNGQLESDLLGRKAAAYSVVPDYRAAVGVELLEREVSVHIVDLKGRDLDCVAVELPYEKDEHYFLRVCELIKDLVGKHAFCDEQILGVGIAVQGLVSEDGKSIVYGAIMENTGLGIDAFSRHIPYPCRFIHDSESAALWELWNSPERKDAIYLSLSHHLGGAIIARGLVRAGKHGHHATFEHIQIESEGKLCYCGRRGCMETVLSMDALLDGEAPEPFFRAVRMGREPQSERWNSYLSRLAKLIGNLHLIMDFDVILGGALAPYFSEEDIRYLYQEIDDRTPFPDAFDYISVGSASPAGVSRGAALLYIRPFLEDIDAP